MTEYYFKVRGERRNYYCAINAESANQARRNLLFCCFSYKEDMEEPFKRRYPDVTDRYGILLLKHLNKIQEITKRTYDKNYDPNDSE